MFSGTFLKLSTLKILLCPLRISSHYKFIGKFARLLTSFFLRVLWFIVRVRVSVRVRVEVRLRVRYCVTVGDRVRIFVRVRVQVMVRV